MDKRKAVDWLVKELKLWRILYSPGYIRRHFVIGNHDGEAEAVLDALAKLLEKTTPTPSEQLQAELEPLPGSYPGKFHVG